MYRYTCLYTCVIITLIFILQVYRYFIALPANTVQCEQAITALSLVPLIGPILDML